MKAEDLAELIRSRVAKSFFINVHKGLERAFAEAPRVIDENTELRAYRAARVKGQLRFAMVEEAFEKTGQNLGAINLYREELPGLPDALAFQPLQQFGDVIMGFASHPKPGSLPAKNKTRLRAVQLNLPFIGHLALKELEFEQPHLYVCLLTSPDLMDRTKVGSIELGVIDPRFDGFAFHEPLETFLRRYETGAGPSSPAATGATQPSLVKLRAKKESTDNTDAADSGS